MKRHYIIIILAVAAIIAALVVYVRSKKVQSSQPAADDNAPATEIHIKPAVSIADMERSIDPATIQKGTQIIDLSKFTIKS